MTKRAGELTEEEVTISLMVIDNQVHCVAIVGRPFGHHHAKSTAI